MKIRLVGAKLLHVDERTERRRNMTKLRVAFPYLDKEHKNEIIQYILYNFTRSDSEAIHAKNTK